MLQSKMRAQHHLYSACNKRVCPHNFNGRRTGEVTSAGFSLKREGAAVSKSFPVLCTFDMPHKINKNMVRDGDLDERTADG